MKEIVYDKIVEDLYTEIPIFKDWIEKNDGYDVDLTYPVFFALSHYFKNRIEEKDEQTSTKISSFIERMAQSDDENIKSLLSDFLSSDEFLLGDFHKSLADHLGAETKKLFDGIYLSYINRQ